MLAHRKQTNCTCVCSHPLETYLLIQKPSQTRPSKVTEMKTNIKLTSTFEFVSIPFLRNEGLDKPEQMRRLARAVDARKK